MTDGASEAASRPQDINGLSSSEHLCYARNKDEETKAMTEVLACFVQPQHSGKYQSYDDRVQASLKLLQAHEEKEEVADTDCVVLISAQREADAGQCYLERPTP